jgi:hypothetical protein
VDNSRGPIQVSTSIAPHRPARPIIIIIIIIIIITSTFLIITIIIRFAFIILLTLVHPLHLQVSAVWLHSCDPNSLSIW